MFTEVLEAVNKTLEEASYKGPLPKNIATFSRIQYDAFIDVGFNEAEALQMVIAILGKKS